MGYAVAVLIILTLLNWGISFVALAGIGRTHAICDKAAELADAIADVILYSEPV